MARVVTKAYMTAVMMMTGVTAETAVMMGEMVAMMVAMEVTEAMTVVMTVGMTVAMAVMVEMEAMVVMVEEGTAEEVEVLELQ